MQNTVKDIRNEFVRKYKSEDYVNDKTGVKTIEIVNASFIANKPTIFGKVNEDYIQRELEWYNSQSLNVNDIPGDVPKIWQMISDKNGKVNSNYGYLTLSKENGNQYFNCAMELHKNPDSRRAVMIYTRPSIWSEYNKNGMSDFICTNAVQYLIRNNKLDVVVQMRSNDVVFGYRNDYAWQKHMADMMCHELKVELGNIHWNVGSLHVYERHFNFIDTFIEEEERKQECISLADQAFSNTMEAISFPTNSRHT
jgi:thymidylate synthase